MINEVIIDSSPPIIFRIEKKMFENGNAIIIIYTPNPKSASAKIKMIILANKGKVIPPPDIFKFYLSKKKYH